MDINVVGIMDDQSGEKKQFLVFSMALRGYSTVRFARKKPKSFTEGSSIDVDVSSATR
jgi:hypothetical protein